MAKKYTGSLSLEWFNKQKSILIQEESGKKSTDIRAPFINWINKDEALFYEISEEENKGLEPYWVNRDDIRVKEARPLNFVKAVSYNEKSKGNIQEEKSENTEIENLLIRGDNLLALNSLVKLFNKRENNEKAKCIYIDPPYNIDTAFKYYLDSMEHSEWLTMMRDRLVLMKQLLAREGSIWISIDDDEAHYMKVLCDEIFGRDNFIASNVWQKRYSRENREAIGDVHEYIMVYAVDAALFKHVRNKVEPTEEQKKVYKNPNNDPRGRWRPIPMTAQEGHATASQYYEVVTPSGAVHVPPKGRCWGISKETYEKYLAEGRIWFGKEGSAQPNIIRYLSEIEGFAPWTWWPSTEVGHTDEAKKEMHALFGKEAAFDTPKPERLMKRIIEIATDEGDLVMDFFLGSGTTAAVCQKMKRRWIGVEIGTHAESHVIPRLKKVISGEDQGGISKDMLWNGGGGFKYYKLGESILKFENSGRGDFNWELEKSFLESSLLASYDFVIDSTDWKFEDKLFDDGKDIPQIGTLNISGSIIIGVASLAGPSEQNTIMSNDELNAIIRQVRRKGPRSIVLFTNKGIEMAYDSKPDDLEIIKVPFAIFAELEK